tara:strand:- start:412 stop:1488 length:1077 start_codon:yes stop_codon:yes gene_type:complete
MPIPKPKTGESRSNFMSRCMGDNTMTEEYDTDQRLAVCNSSYNSKEEEQVNDEKREVSKDVFTTEAEAQARAEEIGCSGTHSHDEDGNTVFMPCGSHADYTRLTGEELDNEESGYGYGGRMKPKKKKPKKKEAGCTCDDNISELKSYVEVHSEIKADANEDGTFEGYGSVFNNTDLGNDVIKSGAFTKSLQERGTRGVKLLYQHKSDMPIGVFDEIREDSHGLRVKGRLALGTTAGRDAYELLKMGALDGLSIGFRVNPKEVSFDKRNNQRIIKEVDLMEISLVTFPMNPKATVRQVKGEEISIREWESGLRDAFNLSRSEAKVAAKAVNQAFTQREVDDNAEVVEAIKKLTLIINQL